MHRTKNDLDLAVRTQVAELLNQALAETLDLKLQAKQAHWNVKGPNFIGLHELFDDVAAGLEDHSDLLAERIVQLGGAALGTVQAVSSASQLPVFPTGISAEQEVVEALSNGMAALGKRIRGLLDTTGELGDQDSADICTEISRALDKHLWFVESHLG
jgi:starvation-inducible DNA-binding protein